MWDFLMLAGIKTIEKNPLLFWLCTISSLCCTADRSSAPPSYPLLQYQSSRKNCNENLDLPWSSYSIVHKYS